MEKKKEETRSLSLLPTMQRKTRRRRRRRRNRGMPLTFQDPWMEGIDYRQVQSRTVIIALVWQEAFAWT